MSKQIQLFLFPFAGGSSSVFKDLTAWIGDHVETISVEYPGRGRRKNEPFASDYKSLLEDVSRQVNRRRKASMPFAILGYSMGSNLAYDLVVGSSIQGEASHLFLCARDSVDKRGVSYSFGSLPEEDFIDRIAALGGIDDRILHNKKFLSIYLKPVREDYRLLGEFRYHEDSRKISCPSTVIYCEKDTPFREVERWKELTDKEIDFYEMGEDHFFIKGHFREMADIINGKLRKNGF